MTGRAVRITGKFYRPVTLRRWLLALVLLLCLAASLRAEDKKEEPKKEPPRVVVVVPLGVEAGTSNTIKIRGINLTNATALRFPGLKTGPDAKIISAKKIDIPKEADAKKVGDTQLEVQLLLPPEAPAGPTPFVVVMPDGGTTQTNLLLVYAPGTIGKEKEPNGGFRQPQDISFSRPLLGAISEANDVDVFRFSGQAGQTIIAEVQAARLGSLLDASLMLYDVTGHVLAGNDDSPAGADPELRFKLPADGVYFLSLFDAQDKGGPTHVYQFILRLEK